MHTIEHTDNVYLGVNLLHANLSGIVPEIIQNAGDASPSSETRA